MFECTEKKKSVWHSTVPSPFTHRCAVPTTRQILLCKNSNLKCGMKWPMWRGECYLPPCCNTVAGWAQSPLWYPSFKSRPFSLFVCLFYFRSPSCNTLWVTNSLSPVCCVFFYSLLHMFCGLAPIVLISILYIKKKLIKVKKNIPIFLLFCPGTWLYKQPIETGPQCILAVVYHLWRIF